LLTYENHDIKVQGGKAMKKNDSKKKGEKEKNFCDACGLYMA
jgi:hypothetical protein